MPLIVNARIIFSLGTVEVVNYKGTVCRYWRHTAVILLPPLFVRCPLFAYTSFLSLSKLSPIYCVLYMKLLDSGCMRERINIIAGYSGKPLQFSLSLHTGPWILCFSGLKFLTHQYQIRVWTFFRRTAENQRLESNSSNNLSHIGL